MGGGLRRSNGGMKVFPLMIMSLTMVVMTTTLNCFSFWMFILDSLADQTFPEKN